MLHLNTHRMYKQTLRPPTITQTCKCLPHAHVDVFIYKYRLNLYTHTSYVHKYKLHHTQTNPATHLHCLPHEDPGFQYAFEYRSTPTHATHTYTKTNILTHIYTYI